MRLNFLSVNFILVKIERDECLMFAWIKSFKQSSTQTKWFIFNTILHGSIIILTAIYCYARLDFVRSHKNVIAKTERLQDK